MDVGLGLNIMSSEFEEVSHAISIFTTNVRAEEHITEIMRKV